MTTGNVHHATKADLVEHVRACVAGIRAAEARELAALPTNAQRTARLAAIESKRGREAAALLRTEVWALMRGRG